MEGEICRIEYFTLEILEERRKELKSFSRGKRNEKKLEKKRILHFSISVFSGYRQHARVSTRLGEVQSSECRAGCGGVEKCEERSWDDRGESGL